MRLIRPLEWPHDVKRRHWNKTIRGDFTADKALATVASAVAKLETELSRHEATGAELSGGFLLTKGGNVSTVAPKFGEDPAVVLRYDIGSTMYCLPCDTYDTLAMNIAAIANHLEAIRRIVRYGVGTTEQMMGAFVALPAPKSWQQILGASTFEEAERNYRALALKHHPDQGGNAETFREITEAIETARKEFGK